MGLFDGCRCRRRNLHGSKQLVYVVRACAETRSGRGGSWRRIAKLRPVLHRAPLAFLIRRGEKGERPGTAESRKWEGDRTHGQSQMANVKRQARLVKACAVGSSHPSSAATGVATSTNGGEMRCVAGWVL